MEPLTIPMFDYSPLPLPFFSTLLLNQFPAARGFCIEIVLVLFSFEGLSSIESPQDETVPNASLSELTCSSV